MLTLTKIYAVKTGQPRLPIDFTPSAFTNLRKVFCYHYKTTFATILINDILNASKNFLFQSNYTFRD
jgi:hypothetical protein